VALTVLGAHLLGGLSNGAQAADGDYGTMLIDVGPLDGNSATAYGTINMCKGNVAADSSFDIDVIIDSANDLAAPYFILNYDNTKLEVTARSWVTYKMGNVPIESSDSTPDTDGAYMWSCGRGALGGVNDDGVIVRITLHALSGASGTTDLTLCKTEGDCPNAADSNGDDHFYPQVVVDDPAGTVRVAVGQTCSKAATPTPPTLTRRTPTATPLATPATTAPTTP
jgi:hypothetical protein